MSRGIKVRNDSEIVPISIMVGIIIGILFTALMYEFLPESIVVKANSVIELCEQDLPRTQRCIITAIPEEK